MHTNEKFNVDKILTKKIYLKKKTARNHPRFEQ